MITGKCAWYLSIPRNNGDGTQNRPEITSSPRQVESKISQTRDSNTNTSEAGHREVPADRMDMPILEGYEEDIPMTSEPDSEVTADEIVNPNKRRHREATTEELVFQKKTTKVSTLTPTPKGPLPTSNRFQDLPRPQTPHLNNLLQNPNQLPSRHTHLTTAN